MRDTTILVIDRDEATCVLLREIFEAEGYATTWCASLAAAEEAMIHTRPDVVLFGIARLSGPEVAVFEMIRRYDPSLPVVLMSTSLDLRDWATNIGAEAYLSKPFDVAVPLDIVEHVLRVARDDRPGASPA